MSRTLWATIAIAGVAMLAGCGNKPNTASALTIERKAALEELGELLKSLAHENRKPPAGLAELDPLEPMIPVAGPAIRNGSVVYFWGVAYAAGSKHVAAHEKSLATESGFVLLQDGTVKEMTAAEFQAASKAKK